MYLFWEIFIIIALGWVHCHVCSAEYVENYAEEALTVNTEDLGGKNGQDNADRISPTDAEIHSNSNLDEVHVNPSEGEINSAQNITSSIVNATKAKVTCKRRNFTDANVSSVEVQIVNGSTLLNMLLDEVNSTATECVAVLFYAPWCNFSASAAPHYNALPRLYPNITCLAVDTLAYSRLCATFGIVAVPTILLFHNGHAVAKFNGTLYTVDNFSKFLTLYTGLKPTGPVNVTEQDYLGPLPSTPSDEIDFHLWIAWLFILACCVCGFLRSSVCQQIIESIRNDWREAEAQHEHVD